MFLSQSGQCHVECPHPLLRLACLKVGYPSTILITPQSNGSNRKVKSTNKKDIERSVRLTCLTCLDTPWFAVSTVMIRRFMPIFITDLCRYVIAKKLRCNPTVDLSYGSLLKIGPIL